MSGPTKYSAPWGGPACYGTAQQFQRYMCKYNKTHDMVAPFVVNSRRNGLLLPEGYWAQHRPEALTAEDYNEARWIAKPANLYDNDIPIHACGAYVITPAERAKDLQQKPVYVLGHAGAGQLSRARYSGVRPRGPVETRAEAQPHAPASGRQPR